jgi:hypothetical protein
MSSVVLYHVLYRIRHGIRHRILIAGYDVVCDVVCNVSRYNVVYDIVYDDMWTRCSQNGAGGRSPQRARPAGAPGPLATAGRGLLTAAAETSWRAETQPGRRSGGGGAGPACGGGEDGLAGGDAPGLPGAY